MKLWKNRSKRDNPGNSTEIGGFDNGSITRSKGGKPRQSTERSCSQGSSHKPARNVSESRNAQTLNGTEYLYIAEARKLGLRKIGRTKDPHRRRSELDKGPVDVTLVYFMACDNAAQNERKVLDKHRNRVERGEWVRSPSDQIARDIELVCRRSDGATNAGSGDSAGITALPTNGWYKKVRFWPFRARR
jgi:hypothetical protein